MEWLENSRTNGTEEPSKLQYRADRLMQVRMFLALRLVSEKLLILSHHIYQIIFASLNFSNPNSLVQLFWFKTRESPEAGIMASCLPYLLHMNKFLYGLKSALLPTLILSIFTTAGEPILANQQCSHLFLQTETPKRLTADDLYTLYTSKDATPEAINLMLRQMDKIEIALFFNDFGFRVDKTSPKDVSYVLQLRNDNPYLDILKPFEQAGFQFAFSPSKSVRDQITVDWSTRTLWIDLRTQYPHNGGYQKADFLEFLKKTQDPQFDTYSKQSQRCRDRLVT